MNWIHWLIKIPSLFRGKSVSEIAAMNETYRKHIEYLKKELDEKIAIIEQYKAKHPENGVEYNIWKQEAEAAYLKQVALLKENRDLKEKIIFLNHELTAVRKKHRGMYE